MPIPGRHRRVLQHSDVFHRDHSGPLCREVPRTRDSWGTVVVVQARGAKCPVKERWGGTRKKPRSRLVLVPLTAGVCSGLLVKALRGTPGMTAFTLRNSDTEGMCFHLPCICLELRLPCKATCGHSGQVVCICTPRPGTQMLGDKASDPGSPGREGLGQTFLPYKNRNTCLCQSLHGIPDEKPLKEKTICNLNQSV